MPTVELVESTTQFQNQSLVCHNDNQKNYHNNIALNLIDLSSVEFNLNTSGIINDKDILDKTYKYISILLKMVIVESDVRITQNSISSSELCKLIENRINDMTKYNADIIKNSTGDCYGNNNTNNYNSNFNDIIEVTKNRLENIKATLPIIINLDFKDWKITEDGKIEFMLKGNQGLQEVVNFFDIKYEAWATESLSRINLESEAVFYPHLDIMDVVLTHNSQPSMSNSIVDVPLQRQIIFRFYDLDFLVTSPIYSTKVLSKINNKQIVRNRYFYKQKDSNDYYTFDHPSVIKIRHILNLQQNNRKPKHVVQMNQNKYGSLNTNNDNDNNKEKTILLLTKAYIPGYTIPNVDNNNNNNQSDDEDYEGMYKNDQENNNDDDDDEEEEEEDEDIYNNNNNNNNFNNIGNIRINKMIGGFTKANDNKIKKSEKYITNYYKRRKSSNSFHSHNIKRKRKNLEKDDFFIATIIIKKKKKSTNTQEDDDKSYYYFVKDEETNNVIGNDIFKLVETGNKIIQKNNDTTTTFAKKKDPAAKDDSDDDNTTSDKSPNSISTFFIFSNFNEASKIITGNFISCNTFSSSSSTTTTNNNNIKAHIEIDGNLISHLNGEATVLNMMDGSPILSAGSLISNSFGEVCFHPNFFNITNKYYSLNTPTWKIVDDLINTHPLYNEEEKLIGYERYQPTVNLLMKSLFDIDNNNKNNNNYNNNNNNNNNIQNHLNKMTDLVLQMTGKLFGIKGIFKDRLFNVTYWDFPIGVLLCLYGNLIEKYHYYDNNNNNNHHDTWEKTHEAVLIVFLRQVFDCIIETGVWVTYQVRLIIKWIVEDVLLSLVNFLNKINFTTNVYSSNNNNNNNNNNNIATTTTAAAAAATIKNQVFSQDSIDAIVYLAFQWISLNSAANNNGLCKCFPNKYAWFYIEPKRKMIDYTYSPIPRFILHGQTLSLIGSKSVHNLIKDWPSSKRIGERILKLRNLVEHKYYPLIFSFTLNNLNGLKVIITPSYDNTTNDKDYYSNIINKNDYNNDTGSMAPDRNNNNNNNTSGATAAAATTTINTAANTNTDYTNMEDEKGEKETMYRYQYIPPLALLDPSAKTLPIGTLRDLGFLDSSLSILWTDTSSLSPFSEYNYEIGEFITKILYQKNKKFQNNINHIYKENYISISRDEDVISYWASLLSDATIQKFVDIKKKDHKNINTISSDLPLKIVEEIASPIIKGSITISSTVNEGIFWLYNFSSKFNIFKREKTIRENIHMSVSTGMEKLDELLSLIIMNNNNNNNNSNTNNISNNNDNNTNININNNNNKITSKSLLPFSFLQNLQQHHDQKSIKKQKNIYSFNVNEMLYFVYKLLPQVLECLMLRIMITAESEEVELIKTLANNVSRIIADSLLICLDPRNAHNIKMTLQEPIIITTNEKGEYILQKQNKFSNEEDLGGGDGGGGSSSGNVNTNITNNNNSSSSSINNNNNNINELLSSSAYISLLREKSKETGIKELDEYLKIINSLELPKPITLLTEEEKKIIERENSPVVKNMTSRRGLENASQTWNNKNILRPYVVPMSQGDNGGKYALMSDLPDNVHIYVPINPTSILSDVHLYDVLQLIKQTSQKIDEKKIYQLKLRETSNDQIFDIIKKIWASGSEENNAVIKAIEKDNINILKKRQIVNIKNDYLISNMPIFIDFNRFHLHLGIKSISNVDYYIKVPNFWRMMNLEDMLRFCIDLMLITLRNGVNVGLNTAKNLANIAYVTQCLSDAENNIIL
uniref:Wsv289-like protein n=1 Tax=Metapenaeus joyneri majanivirus TaxID=2984280 RepID=A0A9C7F6Z7_9VIRU|nr:MAG: wsv289-like protein [Metapenaeus joyneri majanivirus]